MGCVSSQTFEVQEELVDPEDYNNDPVLILSGRRQSFTPTSVHLHKIKKVSSTDAETHNRDMVMHLSDQPLIESNSETTSLTRRLSILVRQHPVESSAPDGPQNKKLSIYRRQSSVEVVTPPRSPNHVRRVSSLIRRKSSRSEVCMPTTCDNLTFILAFWFMWVFFTVDCVFRANKEFHGGISGCRSRKMFFFLGGGSW